MSKQLTLNIALRDGLRFSSFYYNDKNSQLYFILKAFSEASQQIGIQQIFLWGGTQSGKSHLLQACCYQLAEQGLHASYLPLNELSLYGTQILSGLHNSNLIVIDDIDIVLGDKNWEEALLNLINQAYSSQQRLLFSAKSNPRDIKCRLPRLSSRLIGGSSYQLKVLSSEEKPQLFRFKAQQRGFNLDDRVIDYIYKHYLQDTDSLLEILDQLDQESLRQKARVTIPFVKQVIESKENKHYIKES
ncbi:MAG: DnaA regulatory inactivator Hda [Cocleimonas sp.]|nr:DnaA regulatory inactivator Hda [Cocleimonas sp.]